MAKCLVLGGNGFIGSHLVDALVLAGHTVRAFDRYGSRSINYIPNENIESFEGDFLNSNDRTVALEGMEYVFHFVSTTTPISAENDPLIDIETNVQETVKFLQECSNQGVKKVIFASTGGAIYGANSTEEPIPESIVPAPFSPYAIGKLTIEHYLRYFQKKHGLSSVVFRISNPYGERQSLTSKQGVVPIFLQRIAKDEPITVLGDGSMVRDFIYVQDVAAMIAGSFQSATQGLYNLGSGQGVNINELVKLMKSSVGKTVKIEYKDNPSTFVDKVVLDTTLFSTEFGLKPETSLKSGVEKTWHYVQEKIGKAES